MFQLELQAIYTVASAQNKEEAIRQVAAALTAAGNVSEGYVNGILARERQTSTFLVNGIAIPHGTTDTRDLVLTTEFIIRNEHGLHARRGTALVSVIKQFNSDITVTNLDGSGKPANGRSLMKVVALGVRKGHRLRFTASDEDAQQALNAIEKATNSGLGEGAA